MRLQRSLWIIILGSAMAACSVYPPAPTPAPEAKTETGCEPVPADDVLIGNWLSKRSEEGVVGELRTLFTLQADGRMLFTEQLKRQGQPSQGISESGCWQRDAETLILQTRESNGVEVEDDDPIYTNRYAISHSSADKLRLRSDDGMVYSTERTSPGYRLPF